MTVLFQRGDQPPNLLTLQLQLDQPGIDGVDGGTQVGLHHIAIRRILDRAPGRDLGRPRRLIVKHRADPHQGDPRLGQPPDPGQPGHVDQVVVALPSRVAGTGRSPI